MYLITTVNLRCLTNKLTDPKNFQHHLNVLHVANSLGTHKFLLLYWGRYGYVPRKLFKEGNSRIQSYLKFGG